MKEVKFYQLENSNIVAVVSGDVADLPGAKLLVPGSVDTAQEKHVPAVEKVGNVLKVQIGSVIHPMLENHYIQWIAVATDDTVEIRYLKPGDVPKAEFTVSGPGTVYEYCNLHGLWKTSF